MSDLCILLLRLFIVFSSCGFTLALGYIAISKNDVVAAVGFVILIFWSVCAVFIAKGDWY